MVVLHDRQGDVLILKIPDGKVAKEAKPMPADPKLGVVLAYGEVTGHAHRLDPGVCCLYAEEDAVEGFNVEALLADIGGGAIKDSDRFLEVKKTTLLTHDEHDPVQLDDGVYLVRRQREYDPEVERLVAD